jgi:outer membrane protein OmpA-like peptidoglycan-associated protein
MRYWFSAAAMMTLATASVVPAHAQTPVVWGGPYGGVNLGADWGHMPGSASVTPSGAVPRSALGFSHGSDTTITGGGQAGYNYQMNNFVLGVEGDFNGGGPSSTTTMPTPTVPSFGAGSKFTTSSDWNASLRGRVGYAVNQFLIYGTGGVAFADAGIKANYASPAPGVAGGSASSSTTLIGGTYGGGVEYAVTPNISVAGEFRHTDYGSAHMSLGSVSTAAGSAPVTSKIDMHDNVALLKVNYRFGAPPPPPPAMPMAMPAAAPPPAAKVFIVFFDWDKDTITQEGQQIVQQAADAYKSGAPVQIQVTGYTDRSGSPAYNQRLSERRANNVARALAALGVPQSQMAVSGRGENDNRVPTAAGVREPQNRRVEITTP